MKKIIYSIFVFVGLSLTNCSEEISHKETTEQGDRHKKVEQEKRGEAKEEAKKINFPVEDGYEFYGTNEVKPDEAITVEEMVTKIYSEGNFEGNVTAILDGVCKKQGCWVTMTNKNGESVRVRFKNHSFGVPTDTPVGTEVVLRGIGTIDTTTIELQKHYLDDAKEAGQEVTQDQYDLIAEDLIEVSFISDGILVKK